MRCRSHTAELIRAWPCRSIRIFDCFEKSSSIRHCTCQSPDQLGQAHRALRVSSLKAKATSMSTHGCSSVPSRRQAMATFEPCRISQAITIASIQSALGRSETPKDAALGILSPAKATSHRRWTEVGAMTARGTSIYSRGETRWTHRLACAASRSLMSYVLRRRMHHGADGSLTARAIPVAGNARSQKRREPTHARP